MMFASVLSSLVQCRGAQFAVILTLSLISSANALAQNGAFYYAPAEQLFVYTGNSGHDVTVGVVLGYAVVIIDNVNYPVYSSGSTLLNADEISEIIVDTGDDDDDIDLSLVNDTAFSSLEYVDVYMEDGDDIVDGPTSSAAVDIYGGDGDDTAIVNGNDYGYPDDDVQHIL